MGVLINSFGELLNQTGTTENNFLFAGEQFDGDLDQYYLRARYYDQSVGRFTQQDEWMGRDGEPVTLNKYVYAHADPVNFVDPSGYFGLSDVMGAVNVQGVLTIIGTRAGANAAGRRLLWNGACFVVEEMAEAAISQAVGLYIFDDILVNKPYVGQSKSNIVDRLNSHFRVTRTYIDNVTHVLPVSVAPGVSDKLHDVLDALEQSFIDDFNGPGGKKGQSGGSANKRNQVDVTKDKRKYLKDLMDKFKICPK